MYCLSISHCSFRGPKSFRAEYVRAGVCFSPGLNLSTLFPVPPFSLPPHNQTQPNPGLTCMRLILTVCWKGNESVSSEKGRSSSSTQSRSSFSLSLSLSPCPPPPPTTIPPVPNVSLSPHTAHSPTLSVCQSASLCLLLLRTPPPKVLPAAPSLPPICDLLRLSVSDQCRRLIFFISLPLSLSPHETGNSSFARLISIARAPWVLFYFAFQLCEPRPRVSFRQIYMYVFPPFPRSQSISRLFSLLSGPSPALACFLSIPLSLLSHLSVHSTQCLPEDRP